MNKQFSRVIMFALALTSVQSVQPAGAVRPAAEVAPIEHELCGPYCACSKGMGCRMVVAACVISALATGFKYYMDPVAGVAAFAPGLVCSSGPGYLACHEERADVIGRDFSGYLEKKHNGTFGDIVAGDYSGFSPEMNVFLEDVPVGLFPADHRFWIMIESILNIEKSLADQWVRVVRLTQETDTKKFAQLRGKFREKAFDLYRSIECYRRVWENTDTTVLADVKAWAETHGWGYGSCSDTYVDPSLYEKILRRWAISVKSDNWLAFMKMFSDVVVKAGKRFA